MTSDALVDEKEAAIEYIEQHGHGHVLVRKDGLKARCGGAGVCSTCKSHLDLVHALNIERVPA